MTCPLIDNPVLVAALAVCGLCGFLAVGVCRSRRFWLGAMKVFLSWPPLRKAVFILLGTIATALAQKSGTNAVNGVDATNGIGNVTCTNDVDGVGDTNVIDIANETNEVGSVVLSAPQPMINGGTLSCGFGAMGTSRPTIAACDIGRGCRLDSVTTNDAISYEMPDNAVEVGTWRLTGAYDDVVRADLGEFRFPLGTNLCSSLWAHTWGTARPQLRIFHSPFSIFNSNELVAVGAPMSAIPDVSRFWAAPTTNDTFLLTWENFAVGRLPAPVTRDASGTVNAQIELKRNGDFFARSNSVESVYRRVNPDDWDDDGWSNDDDPSPYEADVEDGFGPHQDLSFIVHSNNYYWVDLVVSNANALVTFESELPSELPNPQFIARAGATNRVVLLLGKPYEVKCAQPIVCVESSHDDVDVTERGEDGLDICRPVVCEIVSMPLLMASPRGRGLLGLGGGSTIRLTPEPEGCEVSWGDCCCVTRLGNGFPYFSCAGDCGCGGCARSDITVAYDGTGLTFPGFSCPCASEPGPGPDQPQGDPDGPSVSASFSKQAVIFEDEYENEPGVTIPRRSTDVEVSYYVNGGTNGGTYAFTLVNGAKLLQVEGGTLPVTGHVSATESKMVTARYEGRLASGSEGDIIAKAEFIEDETGHLISAVDMATSVSIGVYAAATCADNPCRHRRMYGIAERVNCLSEPVGSVHWTVEGEGTFESSTLFRCSLNAEACELTASAKDASLSVVLNVIRPSGIAVTNVSELPYSPGKNVAGYCGIRFGCLTLLPTSVSFGRIYIEEVPTESGICYGYFGQEYFSDCWSHSFANGAGLWVGVYDNNIIRAIDTASCGAAPPPWSDGGMVWAIPVGFHTNQVSLGTSPLGEIPLGVRSVYTMMSSGKIIISKFGHWISRDTNDVVVVDGEVKRGNE